MMRAFVIENETAELEKLLNVFRRVSGVDIIGSSTSRKRALEYISDNQIDVVFMDTTIEGLCGIELAKEISSMNPTIKFIFVTKDHRLALQAFEVNTVDYIVKPAFRQRIEKAVRKIYSIENYENDVAKKKNILIRSFGKFMLIDSAGNEVKWRTQKSKELLAYLWQNRERSIHKDRIMFDLWPEITKNRATALLHTTIYQVRKKLKEAATKVSIDYLNDSYQIKGTFDCDVEQFLCMLQQQPITPQTMKQLIVLYDGDYFEVEDYAWSIDKRASLKNTFINAVTNYVNNLTNKKKDQLVYEHCLEKLVELDPYNEKIVSLQLNYLSELQDRNRFISFYNKVCMQWHDELGLEVPSGITKLYHRYLVRKEKLLT